ncbi:MAG: hypothetical protein WKF92_15925 [Pyrinomonadaceae bacterium]
MSNNLGKLESEHAISPVYLQRAAIIAVLSFVFFVAMLIAFYSRRNIGYFMLSSAFLVVYLFTLVSWVMQRRNVVKIFENGIRYKKFESRWDEIKSAVNKETHIEIQNINKDTAIIPASIQGFERITKVIRKKAA